MRNFKVDTDVDANARVQVEEPSEGEMLQRALFDNPLEENDEAKRAKAQRIARVMHAMDIVRGREEDANDDDTTKYAKALTLAQTLIGDRAKGDTFLRMWSDDGRDFPTGQAALDHMRKIFEHPEDGPGKKFREVSALPYDEQVRMAMEDLSETERIAHEAGEFGGAIRDVIASGAANGSGSVWAGGAGMPESIKVKTAEEKNAERTEYEKKVHAAYMSKLARRARSANIAAIVNNPVMKTDANRGALGILQRLLDSPDNAVRQEDYEAFRNLDDSAKELIISARQVMKPEEPADLLNFIEDAAKTGFNVAAGVVTAPLRQFEKGVLSGLECFGAGIDVNKIARDRQYLWEATGRLDAGGGGVIPQLQFERKCEEYGLIPDALIGVMSVLGYSKVVAQGPAGIAMMAMEGMQQMDDHVAAAGGDISDPVYVGTSTVFGALYGYTEHLQFGGFVKEWTERQMQHALLKGMWRFMKERPGKAVGELLKSGGKESFEEGLQEALLGINEDLALDGDAARHFAENFTREFISSLPTMLVFDPMGRGWQHAKRSGFQRGEAGEANRMANYTDLLVLDAQERRLKAGGKDEMRARAIRLAASCEKEYETYREKGIAAVAEKFGLNESETSALESLYKEMEGYFGLKGGEAEAEVKKLEDSVNAARELLS